VEAHAVKKRRINNKVVLKEETLSTDVRDAKWCSTAIAFCVIG
jgi:hypothetical protein